MGLPMKQIMQIFFEGESPTLIRVGWVIHCGLFKDVHFILLGALTMLAKDSLKLSNTKNICFVSMNH